MHNCEQSIYLSIYVHTYVLTDLKNSSKEKIIVLKCHKNDYDVNNDSSFVIYD